MEIDLNTISFFSLFGFGTIFFGGATALAYWAFKLFGDKWLTAQFSQRLEEYKHSQQKELEDIRFESNKLMDRTTKLHQHEFDVLPEAWALLVDAYGITVGATSSIQRYTTIDLMNETRLDAFLEDSPLLDWEVEELKITDDKLDYYQTSIDRHKLVNVINVVGKFNAYRLKYGIFMLPNIQEDFEQMGDLLYRAQLEYERAINEMHRVKRDARNMLESEGKNLLKKLEINIHERLWN